MTINAAAFARVLEPGLKKMLDDYWEKNYGFPPPIPRPAKGWLRRCFTSRTQAIGYDE